MTSETTSGASTLVRALEREGIDTIFGTVGHGNLAFVDALLDSPIEFVPVHHEQVAAHAADAYFRATGRLAAVTTTVGPGFTNLATGLGDALLDSSALLVIAGGVPSGYVGKEQLQELSLHSDDAQPELFRVLAKRVIRVPASAELAHSLHRAVRFGLSGNPGPVILHVPLDYFSAAVAPRESESEPFRRSRLGADPSALEEAVSLLESAERPLLLAGGGAIISDAGPPVDAFASRHGIPVATTMSGQGIVPEDSELAVGMTGVVGTRPGNYAAHKADVVVALGTRFPEMDSSSWRSDFFMQLPPSRLIHIDVDPVQMGKVYPASVELIGDAARTIEELGDRLAARLPTPPAGWSVWTEELQREKEEWANELREVRESTAFPYEPANLLVELRELLPRETLLVTGVGIRHLVGQHFPFYAPRKQIVGSGFGTMGQEVGATIGATIAEREAPVVGLVGDGAMLACLAALPTAAAAGLPVTWLVIDNGGYASIAVYQAKHFGRDAGTYFGSNWGKGLTVDWVELARSFGICSERVDSRDDLAGAVTRALGESGPSLVQIPVTDKPRSLASGHWDVNDILASTPRPALTQAGT